MTRRLLALDLFCGLGGWSDGLALEGFDVVGVEILPRIAELYKHPCIIADVTTLDGSRFKGFDLIVGSPPCRDFTIMAQTLGHRWKTKPDPWGRGLEPVHAFLQFVKAAQPRYWLMENVPGLKKYLDLAPKAEVHLGVGMRRCFWGTFPKFLVPRDYSHKFHYGDRKPLRSWERGHIPMPCTRSLGRTVATLLSVSLSSEV